MAKKPIKVTEVVLRDAHQSLLATRMTMDEMRPILPEMDKINYFSVVLCDHTTSWVRDFFQFQDRFYAGDLL